MKKIRKYQIAFVTLLALTLAAAGAEENQKLVEDGVSIELEVEGSGEKLVEGDLVHFRFRITDTTTGTPLSGVYPAAWMDKKPEDEPRSPEICRDKVEAFIGGSMFTPPELDLNVYYVLALNSDATISVVDPLFGFGTTKLLDMLFLESPGEDWALSDNQKTLYVSMPKIDQVAIADMTTWEVTKNLDVGARPGRVALQGDGRYLWVDYEEGVTVVDTVEEAVVTNVPTGVGPHEIAFSGDDRYAFVTNGGDGTLSVIDVRELQKVKDVAVGEEPVALAYSEQADSVWVVDRAGGKIFGVDVKRHEVVATAEVGPGLGQIKLAPGGRLAFVVHTTQNTVHILDTALGRVIQTVDVEREPDQVAFSDHLAYVRHRESEIVLMIPLDNVGREGAPVPVIDFPAGYAPFGRVSKPSPADGIVQAPGATAVLVANPADRAIYFYKEGMAAPMGHFQNYGREPRAVLTVDRSLRERTSSGIYETTANLRRPGLYDVAFFLDSPRTIHCFEVEVAPDPRLEAQRMAQLPPRIELVGEQALRVGEKVALQFRLIDPVTKKPRVGLDDVRVLTFRAPGFNHERRAARTAGEGLYRVDFEPSDSGIYFLFVESPTLRLRFDRSHHLVLQAKGGPGTAG